jgi:hypothetical protein
MTTVVAALSGGGLEGKPQITSSQEYKKYKPPFSEFGQYTQLLTDLEFEFWRLLNLWNSAWLGCWKQP